MNKDKDLVLISMLGTRGKEKTTYEIRDEQGNIVREHESDMVLECLCNYLNPQKVIILLTKKARADWEKEIDERLAKKWHIKKADIPDGYSKEEMYEIMSTVVENAPEGARIALDVTHGFRSLPMLAILALIYVENVKPEIDIEGIYYGAFRLGGTPEEKKRTSVLNLDILFYLSRLAQTINQFTTTGVFPKEIGDMIRKRYRKSDIYKVVSSLTDFSDALRAGLYPSMIESGKKMLDNTAKIDSVPLLEKLILERISGSYRFVGKSMDGKLGALSKEEMMLEIEVADWYFQKGLYPQAAFSLRELGVNIMLFRMGIRDNWLDKVKRDEAGVILDQKIDDPLCSWYHSLRDKRNAMAHAELNSQHDVSVPKIKSAIETRIRKVREDFDEWILLPLPVLEQNNNRIDSN